MSYEVAWRKGRERAFPAQVVVDEVEKICAEKGTCAPADLVAASKPKRAPLHSQFTWDDAKAAQHHREWQARLLMNSTYLVKVVQGEKREVAPALVSVRLEGPNESLRGYVNALTLTPRSHIDILQEAVRALHGWVRRYRHLAELDSIIHIIEQELAKL